MKVKLILKFSPAGMETVRRHRKDRGADMETVRRHRRKDRGADMETARHHRHHIIHIRNIRSIRVQWEHFAQEVITL